MEETKHEWHKSITKKLTVFNLRLKYLFPIFYFQLLLLVLPSPPTLIKKKHAKIVILMSAFTSVFDRLSDIIHERDRCTNTLIRIELGLVYEFLLCEYGRWSNGGRKIINKHTAHCCCLRMLCVSKVRNESM